MDSRLILTLVLFHSTVGTILVTQLESCENSLFEVASTIKTLNDDQQVFNVNYNASIPNGENLKGSVRTQLLVGSKWLPLFTLTEEKGVCAMLEKYTGPLFTEVFQAAAMIPRCPIPKGIHLWRNYKPNISKLKMQFPAGRMKLRIEGTEKRTGKLIFCTDLEMVKK